MKKILIILISLIYFLKINAQSYTEGTPADYLLMTNISYSVASTVEDNVSLYMFIPYNAVSGIQNVLIIDNISDLSVPSFINGEIINVGDTLFTSSVNEHFNFYSTVTQTITYSIKSIGTPLVAYETYPCGEFSWVMTLPDSSSAIYFGYFYGDQTCVVNSIDSIPPSTDSIPANESLSLPKLITNTTISIYPNPTKNLITIEGVDKLEITEIKIFDLFGKCILSSNEKSEKTTIDLSSLPIGTYILEITMNQKIIRQKIIKE